jgi:hypothetical protein
MKAGLLVTLMATLAILLPAQRRDTMLIAGHTYEFVSSTESEENGSGDTYITGVVRLDGGRKWLKTMVTEKTSYDCNSIDLELGSYTLEDTLLTVYTLWDHSHHAMAGLRGIRVRRFVFTTAGSLRVLDSRMALTPAPMHQSRQGLSFNDPAQRKAGSDAAERRDQAIFISRLESEYGGEMVFGQEKEALEAEVNALLDARRDELMKQFQ